LTSDAQVWSLGRGDPGGSVEKWPWEEEEEVALPSFGVVNGA
jgi:hypothetical protein